MPGPGTHVLSQGGSHLPYPRGWHCTGCTWQLSHDVDAARARTIWSQDERHQLIPSAPPESAADPVNHPPHYTEHPSGVECITVVEHMGFNLGNAVKYIWRADLKGSAIEDLRKAAWYVQREIDRRERSQS